MVRLPRLAGPDHGTQDLSDDSAQAAAPGVGASRHVLIADDGVDCADTMADLLSIWGFEVAIARDENCALEIARSFDPDAILLDIGLPGGWLRSHAALAGRGSDQRLWPEARPPALVPGRSTNIWSNPSTTQNYQI